MLKELQIQNIILIEKSKISFENGLHIFSGETGAGKTAILQALNLILGSKADSHLIRKGAEKASVCALFDLNSTLIEAILAKAGIESDETLLIKREISAHGKGRVYINNQMAQVNLLKQIAPYLIEVVAQHASQSLLSLDYHREVIDTFGQHLNHSQNVMESYFHLEALKKQYQDLIDQEANEQKLKKQWSIELSEIEEAQITSHDEDEVLFQEYEKLSHTKELFDCLSKTYHLLQEQDPSIVSSLKLESSNLVRMQIQNPEFIELQKELESLSEQLNEFSFSILNFRDTLQENPERLYEIDERLRLLRMLCKQYGPTLQDVITYKEKISLSLNQFENISDQKKDILIQIEEGEKKFQTHCAQLTLLRKKAAKKLQSEIQVIFNDLNLKQAELKVQFTPIEPNSFGAERVEFFLKANKGEKEAALKDRVSGGELSRLLLALKVLLSDLENIPTLIFDEVDANLGGETAPKIGQLLKRISKHKQILVITHLPQVAAYADHHFQISKKEENKRTTSLISKLDEKQKQLEIERMLGGKTFSKKASDLASDLIQSSKS